MFHLAVVTKSRATKAIRTTDSQRTTTQIRSDNLKFFDLKDQGFPDRLAKNAPLK